MVDLELEYHAKYPADPLSVMRSMIIYVLDAAATDPRRRALMEIIYHKCEFVGEMTTLQMMQQNLYLECYEKIEDVLRQCVEAGQLPAGLATRRAAIILRGYVTGVMENWLFLPESFDIAKEAAAMVESFIDMLRFSPTLSTTT